MFARHCELPQLPLYLVAFVLLWYRMKDATILPHPAELRQLRRWVCFRQEHWKSKVQKVPYNIWGYHGSSTKPQQWVSFDEACAAMAAKGFDGISFALHEPDGIACIDLDHVRDSQTGQVEGWADEILFRLSSYTEVSPSGTGFHVFVHAHIPRALKSKQVEIYSKAKFMAMTGDEAFPSTGTIEDADLTFLFDTYGKPASVSRPTTPRPAGKSPSETDYRLISLLYKMYRNTDPDFLEQRFKERFPDRYQQRIQEKGLRNGVNYLRYSIEKFLDKQGATHGKQR